MADRLGNPHRAALLALMAAAKEVSNTELEVIAGFRIKKDVRERLNNLGLVTSQTKATPHVHELTDKGWAWCAEELTAERPPGAGSLGGAFYAVLAGLERFLRREPRRLADVFQPDGEVLHEDLETRIHNAYRKLARAPRDWVRLADLRPLLNGASAAEVDRVLKEMSKTRRANLSPISNSKVLTDADHAAAISIGNQDNHQIAIEES
jgi:hypothetical protein